MIEHTLSLDEPWCVELIDPFTGATLAKLQLSTFHACRMEAGEHAEKYANPDAHHVLWTATAPDHITWELQEKQGGRVIGPLARFGPPWWVPA